jgi:hypothetical protein
VPVVINEFQVLSEPQPEPRKDASASAGDGASGEKIEPCALAAALRRLDAHALRTWAH